MNINIEILKEIIIKVNSWMELFRVLNLNYSGKNIAEVRRQCICNNISYQHFKLPDKLSRSKPSDINIFLNNIKPVTSYKLKQLLFENKLKDYKCECCNATEWNGKPIPLELHHQDGNPKNNTLNNLQILCSNCHANTTNFRASNKNQGKLKIRISDEKLIEAIQNSYTRREALIKAGMAGYGGNYERINKLLETSGVSFIRNENQIKKEQEIAEIRKRFGEQGEIYNISGNPNWRNEAKLSQRRVERPTTEVLSKLIEELSICKIAKQYKVSDNCIRKWCKFYKIEMPNYPLGYWRRRETGMSHEEALNPPPKPEKQKARQLTLEQVADIKKKLINGIGIKELSDEYQFSYECIKGIKYGRSYQSVKPSI